MPGRRRIPLGQTFHHGSRIPLRFLNVSSLYRLQNNGRLAIHHFPDAQKKPEMDPRSLWPLDQRHKIHRLFNGNRIHWFVIGRPALLRAGFHKGFNSPPKILCNFYSILADHNPLPIFVILRLRRFFGFGDENNPFIFF